jgi:hypothetical protein
MRRIWSALWAAAFLAGCGPSPAKAPPPAPPPRPETSRLSSALCADTERPRGFTVERGELAGALALERKADWRGAYEKAFGLAQQGNAVAILHLADLYANPATGFADATESRRLFECAVQLGVPRALVRRGVELAASGHDRASRVAAVGLIERAAALGDLDGLSRLADLVETGRQGWPPAPAAAREIRQLCADAGGHACQFALASRMEATGDARGAYFWLEVLASRPLADDPLQYATRRDAVAAKIGAAEARRTQGLAKRWFRQSWDQVAARWAAARDHIAAN